MEFSTNKRSWVEINLSHYQYNIKQLKKFILPNTEILQVVKADAYGHGAVEISKKAISLGIKFLGVASPNEGLQLREKGINAPIMVLSPSFDYEIDNILDYNLVPTVSTYSFAKELARRGKKIKVHINVDTGMGRSGFYYKSAKDMVEKIYSLPNIEVDGVFSHFAASDDDPDFSKMQKERLINLTKNLTFHPKYIHIANSSALFSTNLQGTNLVRLGLMSYGSYLCFQDKVDLKPVLSFKTRIVQIKTAQKGDSIGYNRKFIAKRQIRYAILPIGYADGYNILLSSKGSAQINGNICPILGKVSMDMIAVDITDTHAKEKDVAIMQGWQDNALKPENISPLFGGSTYEICCMAGRRSTKYFFDSGKLIAVYAHLEREKLKTERHTFKL